MIAFDLKERERGRYISGRASPPVLHMTITSSQLKGSLSSTLLLARDPRFQTEDSH